MNYYGTPFQIPRGPHFLARLAELKRRIAEIEIEVQMRGPPPFQPRPFFFLPNSTGQLASRPGLGGQQRPDVVQTMPRRVRNVSRNLHPCHPCQSRKKKCKRLDKSPDVCERCAERGQKECHPPPLPLTQGHATEEHNVDNLDYASTFAPTARGPTSVSSAVDVSRGGETAGHMVHDGTGNMQGFSCAATYDRIKKENTGWDKGVLIPPA